MYLLLTAAVRQSDSLFALPEDPRKAQPATKSTTSQWIRQLISQTYGLKGRNPPLCVMAHSIRSVGAPWAICHWASVQHSTEWHQHSVPFTLMSVYKIVVLGILKWYPTIPTSFHHISLTHYVSPQRLDHTRGCALALDLEIALQPIITGMTVGSRIIQGLA